MIATRDRIFAAAKDLFDREGLQGLSVREVAKAVNLTPMALYRHFADKDALVDALMLDGFAEWEAIATRIPAEDPIVWLEQMLGAFLDFALTQPHRFDAAFILPARKARRYPVDFEEGRSPVVSLAYARIDQAKAEGKLGDSPTPEIALTLSALGQGFVSMQRAGRFIDESFLRDTFRRAVRHTLASFTKPVSTRKDSR